MLQINGFDNFICNFIQGCDHINNAGFNGLFGHAKNSAGRFILGDDLAAVLFHQCKSLRPIRSHPCHNHTCGASHIMLGNGPK